MSRVRPRGSISDDLEPRGSDAMEGPPGDLAWPSEPEPEGTSVEKEGVPLMGEKPNAPSYSLGAALHESGRCQPCTWYWRSVGCVQGKDCIYCHMCPESELKKRKAKPSRSDAAAGGATESTKGAHLLVRRDQATLTKPTIAPPSSLDSGHEEAEPVERGFFIKNLLLAEVPSSPPEEDLEDLEDRSRQVAAATEEVEREEFEARREARAQRFGLDEHERRPKESGDRLHRRDPEHSSWEEACAELDSSWGREQKEKKYDEEEFRRRLEAREKRFNLERGGREDVKREPEERNGHHQPTHKRDLPQDSAIRRTRGGSRSRDRRARDPPPRGRSRSRDRRTRDPPPRTRDPPPRQRSRSRDRRTRDPRDPPPPPRAPVRNTGSDSHRQIVKEALSILPGKWECKEKNRSQLHTVTETDKSRERGRMTCETWDKEPEGSWRFKKSFAIYVSVERAEVLWGENGTVWLDLDNLSRNEVRWRSTRGPGWRWERARRSR